jgi:hypothetical protein
MATPTLESLLGPSSPIKRNPSSTGLVTPLKLGGGLSSTTPLTPGTALELGFSTEKAALVIEIGSSYTKVGYAGEAAPRRIFSSEFKLHNGEQVR